MLFFQCTVYVLINIAQCGHSIICCHGYCASVAAYTCQCSHCLQLSKMEETLGSTRQQLEENRQLLKSNEDGELNKSLCNNGRTGGGGGGVFADSSTVSDIHNDSAIPVLDVQL